MTSTGEELAERIMPPRGAAQKASASFAEQLTDSPGRSDVDSPSSSNPFCEPAHRTKSVKYRYTATGKHLSSPLKGSSSSPDRKPIKPKKSKLTTLTPAPSSHAAKGKAPAVATTSRKRKASAASLRKEDVLNAIFLSSPSPLSSAPTTPIVSTKDLPSSPTFTAKESIPDLPKCLPVSKTFSLHPLKPTASNFSLLSQPLSPKRKQRKNKTNVQQSAHAWDIGNSVWVLVNQSGVFADNTAHPQNDPQSSESFMWWPAQVVQTHPLRVSMFGEFPSPSSTHRGLCTIFAPSSSNIQSINDDSGAKRFSRATFRLASVSANDDAGPPTKKPRLDDIESMEARWESAVQNMDKASTLEKDGLPALLSSYATTGGTFYDSLDESDAEMSDLRQPSYKPTNTASKKPRPTGSTRKLKAQRSRANLKDDINGTPLRGYSPCPPDLTLQIPGELIFALAPKTGGFYWPAQILQHVPDRTEKYRVKFLDDEEHVIIRDKFFTSEEDGFILCPLGEWESAIKTTDDPESGDEGGEYGAGDANAQDLDESALPPPPPAEDFEDLSVRVQLAYVKPVLQAILNKEYAPARGKHETFMRGGSGRVTLLKSAGVRGGMDARLVKAVQKAICEWVLGDSGLKPGRSDAGDIVTGSSEGDAVAKASPEVASAEILSRASMQDDKMEGVEGVVVPEDTQEDKNDGMTNAALPLTTLYKQVEVAEVSDMAVDGREQDPVDLPPPTNGVTLSPAIKPPKSQLDLLAEVSQAVATEPSLLPSHPEVSKLKVHLLEVTSKSTYPIADEDQPPPSRKSGFFLCEEFESLSGVEKLDYCLNILLPECVQQLILWRSGERTSSTLLSPEEEQRLHDVGARKAAETDWVDDVMRLREAQARLRGIDLNKMAEESKAEVMHGGTRTRPRRATVSRP
ncbi:hypothetical protein L210DRAFT_3641335 [Boletus edulis BED1]|uniref:Uncharacterized protein n=1 Tax=Boletus edulis BED1 TaxID=1328754 RepID=A0AAD4C375_BOLED|nr:hypothetical protein L210DRAFT_3641335 [Boletus edulis BED1]